MAIKELYKSVTGTTVPLSINVSEVHSNSVAIAQVRAESTSLTVGDSVIIDIGYSGNHTQLFTGYVKSIERQVPENTVTIVAHDTLVRAVDYFIAATNPDVVFTRSKISAENLIRDILALAGITNYSGDTSYFTYAWTIPAEINLVNSYDYCNQLASLLAWHIYAKRDGEVRFLDRKPYVMGTDTPEKTIDTDTLLNFSETVSADDLRNRIVVYGGAGVYAEAKASSPYLPAGFYKTAVLSSPILDIQQYANSAVAYNLELYNRLSTYLTFTLEGDPSLEARKVYTLNWAKYGLSGDWYAYSIEHVIGNSGYQINATFSQ